MGSQRACAGQSAARCAFELRGLEMGLGKEDMNQVTLGESGNDMEANRAGRGSIGGRQDAPSPGLCEAQVELGMAAGGRVLRRFASRRWGTRPGKEGGATVNVLDPKSAHVALSARGAPSARWEICPRKTSWPLTF
jgi:hypothetical protein